MLDIRELIRQLQAGQSARHIARNMQLSRVTVGKYRTWAMTHDLLNHALPTAEELARLLAQDQVLHPAVSTISSVEPYRAVVIDLRQRGLEMMAVFQRLRDDHAYVGTYSLCGALYKPWTPSNPTPRSASNVCPAKKSKSISATPGSCSMPPDRCGGPGHSP